MLGACLANKANRGHAMRKRSPRDHTPPRGRTPLSRLAGVPILALGIFLVLTLVVAGAPAAGAMQKVSLTSSEGPLLSMSPDDDQRMADAAEKCAKANISAIAGKLGVPPSVPTTINTTLSLIRNNHLGAAKSFIGGLSSEVVKGAWLVLISAPECVGAVASLWLQPAKAGGDRCDEHPDVCKKDYNNGNHNNGNHNNGNHNNGNHNNGNHSSSNGCPNGMVGPGPSPDGSTSGCYVPGTTSFG
jgi:hypothetical protein